jgi:DNA-binding NtrC family response regulator
VALGDGTPFAALVVDVNFGLRAHPSIQVVYIAGDTPRRWWTAFCVSGSDFLEKPFRAPDLLAAARRALDAPGT